MNAEARRGEHDGVAETEATRVAAAQARALERFQTQEARLGVKETGEKETVKLTRAEEEADFEKDVEELPERLTGLKGGFTRMACLEGDEKGRQAVVWMHGNFVGGRCYTVTVPGGTGVVMCVERVDADAGGAAGNAANVWDVTRLGTVLDVHIQKQ